MRGMCQDHSRLSPSIPFAQADINEEVYIDPPRGFGGADGIHKVLRLLKSLYGLKQAPKTFFDKLKACLEERGFEQSQMDACFFMKRHASIFPPFLKSPFFQTCF